MKIKYPKNTMIFVKTTEQCNLRCEHCYLGMEKPIGWYLPYQAARWLKKYQEETDSALQLCIHGGEPMLTPTHMITTLIDRLREMDINASLSIATNLVYDLTPGRLKVLKRINNIATSWDAGDINRFALSNDHYTWVQNMKTLTEDVDVTVMSSISQGLVNMDPKKYAEKMIYFGTKYIILERLMGTANIPSTIVPKNTDVDNWCLELFKLTIKEKYYEKFSNIIFDSMINAELNGGRPNTYSRNCNSQVLTLNADNTISGCPSAHENRYGTFETSIEELFKSKNRIKFAAHEANFNSEICFKCDQFDFCGGGCILVDWQGNTCNNLPKTMRYIRNYVKEFPTEAENIIQLNKYNMEV